MSWLLLGGMLLLVVANGFFVTAEFALVRVRRSRLEKLERHDARAGVALGQIDEISEYLSACQLGITLASIGIGFLGEPALAGLFEPLFGAAVSHGAAIALSLTLAYLISTVLHITIGEQVPKLLAIAKAEAMAVRIARPLLIFSRAFRPAVVALNGASNTILRALGVDPRAEFEEGTTPEDLKLLIAQSHAGGELEDGEADMLAGVFHLHEQQVRQIMTAIPAMVTVDVSAPLDAAAQTCFETGHTRLVVTENHDRDRVRGILHATDIIRGLRKSGANATIAALVREAPIVPETKSLHAALADLRAQRSSMAVIVDEYGRTAGLVTVEDVLEEIVGDIADETDSDISIIRQTGDAEWQVAGHVPINDLAEYGVILPPGDAVNSIAGVVFTKLGRLPKPGDTVRLGDYRATVRTTDQNRIESVHLRRERAARASNRLTTQT